jgi:hypothetical protein
MPDGVHRIGVLFRSLSVDSARRLLGLPSLGTWNKPRNRGLIMVLAGLLIALMMLISGVLIYG